MKLYTKIILKAALLYTFSFVIHVTSFTYAQNIDSLVLQYRNAKQDSAKLFFLIQLSDNCEVTDIISYAKPAVELADKLLKQPNYSSGNSRSRLLKLKSIALNNLGFMYEAQGNVIVSLDYYKKSLAIRTLIKDKKGIAESLNNLGVVYYKLGDISKALEHYSESLNLSEQLNDKAGISDSQNNIGILYEEQGDVSKAIECFEKCLKNLKEIGDKEGIAKTLNNIGAIYYVQKKYSKALEFYNKSLEIRNSIGDKDGIAMSLNNIGMIYFDKNDINSTLDYFSNSYKIHREMNNSEGIANYYIHMIEVSLKQINYPLAKKYADSSLSLSKELGFPEYIRNSQKLYARVDSARGDFSGALDHFKQYTIYKDSINNEGTRKASVRNQLSYEYEKKEAVLKEQQNNERAIVAQRNRIQQIIIGSAIIGLLLVISFAIFIFRSLNITKKQKYIIEDKQKEILDSINYAKRIQKAILAREEDIKKYLPDSFLLYRPKDIIAGDFYFFEVTDTHIFYAAADCTGHGVPGALMSVVCSNSLTRCVKEFELKLPGEILDKTRELVLETLRKSGEEVKDGMDISLVAILRKDMNVMQWAGANNPLWFVKNGKLEELKGDKQPIGLYDDPKPFTSHLLSFSKGDMVFLFTDGYADQFGGPDGKKFKYKQFKEVLASNASQHQEEQVKILEEKFLNWKGQLDQVDDVCVIGVRV